MAENVSVKKRNKVKLLIALIAVVVALAVLVAVLLTANSGPTTVFFYYIKDGALYQNTTKVGGSVKIADGYQSNATTLYLTECPEADLLFDVKREEGQTIFSLYKRPLSDPNAVPQLVLEDISRYYVSADAEVILYIKENALYQLLDDEHICIDTDYKEMRSISPDGKQVVYKTNDDSLYYYDGDERIKVEEGAVGVIAFDPKEEALTYTKGEKLYQKDLSDNTVVFEDDFNRVLRAVDNRIYYNKTKLQSVPLKDYVVDDVAEQDAAMPKPVRPTRPTKPNRNAYDTDDAYQQALAAYTQALEQYNEDQAAYTVALEAFQAKLNRDGIRRELETAMYWQTTYELYYYDGDTARLICDRVSDSMPSASFENGIIYYAYKTWQFDPTPVKLSEVSSTKDIRSAIMSQIKVEKDERLFYDGTDSPLWDVVKNGDWLLTDDGTTLYGISRPEDDPEAITRTLYRVPIRGDGTPGEAELVDTNMVWHSLEINGAGEPVYFKYRDKICDLYVNGQKIAQDVYPDVNTYQKVCFYTDWNVEERCGTLHRFDGEKTVTIGENVYDYSVQEDGTVLFIADYDKAESKGDLYLWDGEQTVLVDSGVTEIAYATDACLLGKYRLYG